MFLYSGRYINTLEINQRQYECLNCFNISIITTNNQKGHYREPLGPSFVHNTVCTFYVSQRSCISIVYNVTFQFGRFCVLYLPMVLYFVIQQFTEVFHTTVTYEKWYETWGCPFIILNRRIIPVRIRATLTKYILTYRL